MGSFARLAADFAAERAACHPNSSLFDSFSVGPHHLLHATIWRSSRFWDGAPKQENR